MPLACSHSFISDRLKTPALLCHFLDVFLKLVPRFSLKHFCCIRFDLLLHCLVSLSFPERPRVRIILAGVMALGGIIVWPVREGRSDDALRDRFLRMYRATGIGLPEVCSTEVSPRQVRLVE